MTDDTLLSARGLSLSYGAIAALAEVDVDLWPGEMLAVVGEFGFRQDDAAECAVGAPGAGCRRCLVSRSGRPSA